MGWRCRGLSVRQYCSRWCCILTTGTTWCGASTRRRSDLAEGADRRWWERIPGIRQSNPTIIAMKLAMIMGHSAGSAGLALGLLLGEVAYDRQLEPLALAGFEDRHNPQNEEPNADHKLEEWKQEENDPDTRY